jgi:hypothetical protein
VCYQLLLRTNPTLRRIKTQADSHDKEVAESFESKFCLFQNKTALNKTFLAKNGKWIKERQKN